MNIIKAKALPKEITPDDIVLGNKLNFSCCVHKVKWRSNFTFVTLRTGRYTFLTVHNPKFCNKPLKGVKEGVYINVSCYIREEKKAENGLEIAITDYEIINAPCERYPLGVSDKALDCSPEDMIELRSVSMRHPVERAAARILSGMSFIFSQYMQKKGYVNINTPCFTSISQAEDKYTFKTDYFGEAAYVNDEPSIYSQQAIAYYDRVYSVQNTVFGKKRNSPRLLNEYTALHWECAYDCSLCNLMENQMDLIKFIIRGLTKEYGLELSLISATMPDNFNATVYDFEEAMSLLEKEPDQDDLDPTDEMRLCGIAKEKNKTDFVFVTGLPAVKRSFWYRRNGDKTLSFVLLFRGMEIASGGEKIYNYEELMSLVPSAAEYEKYLEYFRYGMPPHGGVSMGAERFVMKLLGLNNIRQAVLYPRDIRNLRP